MGRAQEAHQACQAREACETCQAAPSNAEETAASCASEDPCRADGQAQSSHQTGEADEATARTSSQGE